MSESSSYMRMSESSTPGIKNEVALSKGSLSDFSDSVASSFVDSGFGDKRKATIPKSGFRPITETRLIDNGIADGNQVRCNGLPPLYSGKEEECCNEARNDKQTFYFKNSMTHKVQIRKLAMVVVVCLFATSICLVIVTWINMMNHTHDDQHAHIQPTPRSLVGSNDGVSADNYKVVGHFKLNMTSAPTENVDGRIYLRWQDDFNSSQKTNLVYTEQTNVGITIMKTANFFVYSQVSLYGKNDAVNGTAPLMYVKLWKKLANSAKKDHVELLVKCPVSLYEDGVGTNVYRSVLGLTVSSVHRGDDLMVSLSSEIPDGMNWQQKSTYIGLFEI